MLLEELSSVKKLDSWGFLIGVNVSHVSHSSLPWLTTIVHHSVRYYYFFFMRFNCFSDRKWVSDWSNFDSIKKGLSDLIRNEKLALGYAGLVGMTIAMIAMS